MAAPVQAEGTIKIALAVIAGLIVAAGVGYFIAINQ